QIGVMKYADLRDLMFERYPGPNLDDARVIGLSGFLMTNHWVHIAAVATSTGARIYVNGFLAATNETASGASPNALTPRQNFLGRSVFKRDGDLNSRTGLNGQIAEVRLWAGERTPEQIRGAMFQKLTGQEPDLLGLWNFADGSAND